MTIIIKERNQYHNVPVEAILKLEAVRAYTVVHEKNGRQYVMSSVLGTVLKKLNSNNNLQNLFFRVHRSCAVNLNEIKLYNKGKGSNVVLSDNAVVRVAQRRKTELLRVLQKFRK